MLYHCDDLNVKIVSVNRVRNKAGKFFVKGRPFDALVYRVKGGANFRSGDVSVYSGPTDVFYLSAGTEYEVEYTDGETIAVHFLSDGYLGKAENYVFSDSSSLSELFFVLLSAWENGEDAFSLKACFYRILSEVKAKEAQRSGGFYEAAREMQKRFSDPELSLSALCRLCGIGESTFRLHFSREYNCSPKKYLTRLRLEHAMRLLSDPDCTVERAAIESGFYDAKYFSRIVKKEYGSSPSALRKMNREQ